MNHPTQNEWLLYLDGEASPDVESRLREHLQQCPMCATEIAGWRRSAQKLRRMPFPAAASLRVEGRSRKFIAPTVFKWGLAAAILIFLGFAGGRLSAWRAGSLEKAVTAKVHDDLRRELQADLLAALNPEREPTDEFQRRLRQNVRGVLAQTTNQNARAYRDIMQVVDRQRQQDQLQLVALLQEVRAQQMADCLALRRDLETAVSTADSDLRQNSSRINQLANAVLSVQR